ncbi:MAG TPA: NADH-quinone oxidoreductase subunit J [Chitinophagaceae bacterium]|nr:NADH-quinone oxidoreductase subunit J [Chitinophagaceae bacterium]
MNIIFYIAAIVAIITTIMVITRKNAVHALLYMIVSLLSVAVIFYLLGAPYLAAFEVITYAGAILVLFIFVVMMLNMGKAAERQEAKWFNLSSWLGPGIFSLILLGELIYVFSASGDLGSQTTVISAHEVGQAVFGPYVLGVEMVAMLLMAGVVGAYHIGSEKQKEYHRYLRKKEDEVELDEKQNAEVL